MQYVAIGLGVFVLLIGLYLLVNYNALVTLRNHIREAWSNIDTELKRRYELIPNLVSTVKGYASHESELLARVTELRNRCLTSHGDHAQQAAEERQLVAELQRLWIVAESYPDLKASSNYLQLQEELVNTEDRIQAARRFFNGNVRDYRNKCEMFPSNLVAGMFGFEPESYFEVEPSVKEVPNVNF